MLNWTLRNLILDLKGVNKLFNNNLFSLLVVYLYIYMINISITNIYHNATSIFIYHLFMLFSLPVYLPGLKYLEASIRV